MRPKIRIITFKGGSKELRSHVRMIFSVQPMFRLVDSRYNAPIALELDTAITVRSLVNGKYAVVALEGSHFAWRLLDAVRFAAEQKRGPKPRNLDSKLAREVAGSVASEMRRKAA